MKWGHSLTEIAEFRPEISTKLRDHLSITKAEQFVDLATTHERELGSLLRLDLPELRRLVRAAAQAVAADDLETITTAERGAYPFSTGHESPVDGETFYNGDSGDE